MARAKTRPAEKSVEKARAAKAAVAAQETGERAPNPVWFKPLMFGFILVGLAWLLVYYISDSQWPVPALGNWNIGVGIGVMLVGFLMTTRWR